MARKTKAPASPTAYTPLNLPSMSPKAVRKGLRSVTKAKRKGTSTPFVPRPFLGKR